MTREAVWDAKYVYDSAYHPTTGELVFMPGRMSFQAPGNCIIASGMIIFYRTPIQAIAGQLINQSFNSTVNYCNSPQVNFHIELMGWIYLNRLLDFLMLKWRLHRLKTVLLFYKA